MTLLSDMGWQGSFAARARVSFSPGLNGLRWVKALPSIVGAGAHNVGGLLAVGVGDGDEGRISCHNWGRGGAI